ncbi:hypothetical protein FACS189465_0070 [Clostridia bacterium]|nr:hypothetical protein FACS189465_0070 [Clostridia bacterium]
MSKKDWKKAIFAQTTPTQYFKTLSNFRDAIKILKECELI